MVLTGHVSLSGFEIGGLTVSWQEELRKLDEELASGRLSADDYRVRRDQVLSSAVTSGENPAEGQQAQPQQAQPQQPPAQPDQSADSSANSTQIISPASLPQGNPQQHAEGNQLANAERTQVVSPWQGQPQQQPPQYPQQPGPVSPAAGFQQPGPASPAAGFQQPGPASPAAGFQQPAQPWNAPQADQSPPWGGSEFPPLTPPTQTEETGQGPESFETSSGKGKKIAGIIAAVVLLAGLGVGAWFLFSGGSDDDNVADDKPTQTATNPAPTSSAPPKDDLEIAQLPGATSERTDITSFEDVVAHQVLTEDENKIYEDAGAGEARMVVSELSSDVKVVVLTVQTASASAASTAVDDLVALQKKNGMDPYEGETPQGVEATQVDKNDKFPAAARAHYAHGNTVVRIQVTAPELSGVGDPFEEIIATQLQALPADV